MRGNAMLKGLTTKKNRPALDRREAMARLYQIYSMSQRRACRVIRSDRSSARYCASTRRSGNSWDPWPPSGGIPAALRFWPSLLTRDGDDLPIVRSEGADQPAGVER